MTSKGQLTVPKEVRSALGIGAGDDVEFYIDADGVHVRLARSSDPFGELEGKWRTGTGVSRDEVDAWLREIRGREDSDR